ncbi:DUF6624 domain-containing protein [Streptomyces neyagawaensis]|uniref:DUF6624 domain-containing protein n=1 Tax=Streptomyces neyagawaensis TaxID=42238 RepID=UPI00099F2F03|nr:DUF6624 domain-containing protein [Streptomyces neyagawaensis]MCL6732474.1 hypothetical protein [Streptomyces neyagawaensis]MDE1687112.1 hypothetical protein [Streptomyces neyagawaensis]
MRDAPARKGSPLIAVPPQQVLAAELVRRAEDERRLANEARSAPTVRARTRITECRAGNADALHAIVARHGWPTATLVGEPASTAALMILLHSPDLGFQLTCRDLIAEAVADGRCPAVHHAYIADHCAVELSQPQFYGTRIDPGTLFPYPIRHPETVDERRHDVGLGPLADHLRAVRLGVSGAV